MVVRTDRAGCGRARNARMVMSAAREVLDGLRTSCQVFPSRRTGGPIAETTLGDIWPGILN